MDTDSRTLYVYSFGEFYKDNIDPIFNSINQKMPEVASIKIERYCGLVWVAFQRNTIALFEISDNVNCLSQIAMTMRWMLEMVANLEWLRKNPKYLDELLSSADAAIDRLHDHNDKLDELFYKIKTGVRTTDLIEKIWGKDVRRQFYDYLCGLTHPNILAIHIAESRYGLGVDQFLAQVVKLLSAYTKILKRMLENINDIYLLLDKEEMKKISNKIDDICKRIKETTLSTGDSSNLNED